MLPVTIWMNMPSFYQDDLFGELAKKIDLRVVYDHGLTEDRRRLGWAEPTGKYRTSILSPGMKIRHAVRIAHSEIERIHVVNGIWAETAFMTALLMLGNAGSRFAVYAECPDKTISRSDLRRSAREVVGHWVARRASGLFAVSHFAVDYFGKLGFKENNIYPFGYFRETASALRKQDSNEVSIIYIGQLVRRKGIDVLLDAMAPLWSAFPQVHLSLIGIGPEHESIVAKVRAGKVEDRVKLEGARASSQIHGLLGRASVLVLPSRWDGWGLVINEALSAGVPVIASDRCGAADLIQNGVNGYVFRSEDASSLRACLCAFVGADQKQMRMAALTTGSRLTVPLASDYFVECLEHMCGVIDNKPTPPWEAQSQFLGNDDHQTLTDIQRMEQKSA